MSGISSKFWKTCAKFGQNRRQYSNGIPVEFHQNSTVIQDIYLWNAGGIPLEYCFKIPEFFLEGGHTKIKPTRIIQNQRVEG